MKQDLKDKARALRVENWSIGRISKELGVAKSTTSLWVRDIKLAPEHHNALRARNTIAARTKQADNKAKRWLAYWSAAEVEFQTLKDDSQFMFGLALYIGEGYKASPNVARITNCDPGVIRKGLEFFLRIGVRSEDIKVCVHLHPGLCEDRAVAYWSKLSGLPQSQFSKVCRSVSRASGAKKGNTQEFGTCTLQVCSTEVRQKIGRWMELALE